MSSIYVLRIYEADDTTLAAEFSTDPAHPAPYLLVPDSFSQQEVDLARGSASIGRVDVALIDPPTVAGDQTSGAATAILADAGGYTAVIGHRFWLGEDRGEGLFTLQDGVCASAKLRPSYAGYDFEVKDIRERERNTRAFVSAARRDETGAIIDAPCVWPRGRVAGYGRLPDGSYLVPAAKPVLATFAVGAGAFGLGVPGFSLPSVNEGRVPVDRILTEKMRATLKADPETGTVSAVRLLWRVPGNTAWTLAPPLIPIQYVYQEQPALIYTRAGKYRPSAGGDPVDVHYVGGISFEYPGLIVPWAPGTQVEILLAYMGPPTADFPFRWEGESGELLAELYDGLHSWDWDNDLPPPNPSRIRYQASALAALRTPIRLAREKPADDLRAWAENHIYAVEGAAPALNEDGEIAPVRYELPAACVALTELNDANCAPIPGWEHTSQDAINTVILTYVREYAVPAETDPLQTQSTADGLAQREVEVKEVDEASVALIGEHLLHLKPETLRALGGADGQPFSGDATLEAGHLTARARARQALDRLVLGGQHFSVRAMRSDPAVEAARVGSWAIEGTSWKPDYGTGKRGANRLAQIISRRNVSPAWAEFDLLDAGPANQPLAQPTLGTLTAAGSIVSVPVVAIPAGGEAAIYFAVSTALPANTSGLWTPVPRVSAPGTTVLPSVPAGSVVWVRARSEGPGRRPSAYTNAVSITLPQTPVLTRVTGEIGADVLPYINWVGNPFVAAVRISYAVHAVGATPGTLSQVVQSPLTPVGLPVTLLDGQQVTVAVEPWSGWTGSEVSGTAGTAQFVAIGAAPATEDEVAARSIYDAKKGVAGEDGSIPVTFKRMPGVHSVWGAAYTYPGEEVEANWLDLIGYTDEDGVYHAGRLVRLTEDILIIPPAGKNEHSIAFLTSFDANLRPGREWRFRAPGTLPDLDFIVTAPKSTDGLTATVQVEAKDARGVVTGINRWVTEADGVETGPVALTLTGPLTWQDAPLTLHPHHNLSVRMEATRNDGEPPYPLPVITLDSNNRPSKPDVRLVSLGGADYEAFVDSPDTDAVLHFYREVVGGVEGPDVAIAPRGADPRYGSFPVTASEAGERVFHVYAESAAGVVSEYFDLRVPQYVAPVDTLFSRVDIRMLPASSATQTVLEVHTEPPGGTVTLQGVTGSATRASGPLPGVSSPDGTQWTFNRGAINSGSGQVEFSGTVAGYEGDTDFETIEEQGRDTVYLVLRTRQMNPTSTGATLRVYPADPYPGGDIALAYTFTGVESVSPASPQTVLAAGVTSSPDTTAYVDLAVVYGSTPGRVVLSASRAGRVTAEDAADFPAADRTNGIADVLAVHVANDGGTAHAIAHFDPDTVTGTAAGEYRLDGGSPVAFDITSDRMGAFSFMRSTSGVQELEVRGYNDTPAAGPWHLRQVDRYDPPQPAIYTATVAVEDTGSPGNDVYSVTVTGASMSGKSVDVSFFRNGALRSVQTFASLASDTSNILPWTDTGAGDNVSDTHYVTAQLYSSGTNYGPLITSRPVASSL